jgi:NhaP-type Na+/H+ or K+/H+ antiporter
VNKFEKYIEGFREDVEESLDLVIPAILGLIVFTGGIEISKRMYEYPPENVTKLILISTLFIWGFIGLLSYKKGRFLQIVVVKDVFAKIFGVLIMIFCWGFALATLISIFV